MRLIFGMILGAALTIGGAYVADTAKTGADARPMVNWGIVAQNVDALVSTVKSSWSKLTADR